MDLHISKDLAKKCYENLEKDSLFLAKLGLIDYSLLVIMIDWK